MSFGRQHGNKSAHASRSDSGKSILPSYNSVRYYSSDLPLLIIRTAKAPYLPENMGFPRYNQEFSPISHESTSPHSKKPIDDPQGTVYMGNPTLSPCPHPYEPLVVSPLMPPLEWASPLSSHEPDPP